jgi:Uma2 family endonuclease
MKTYTKPKLTFDEFLEQCPEEGLYELVDGEIIVDKSDSLIKLNQNLLKWLIFLLLTVL